MIFANSLRTSKTPIIYYLASPYSDPDPLTRDQRYLKVMECASSLLNQNILTFSPILYSHEMSKKYSLPTDAAWWWDFNRTMMDKCENLIILKLPGWDKSVGVKQEKEYAQSMSYPIYMFNDSKYAILQREE